MCSSWCYRSAMTNAAATDWYLLGPQSPNLINSFKHARSPVFEYPNCRGGTVLGVSALRSCNGARQVYGRPGVGGCKIPIAPDDFLFGIVDYFGA